MEDVGRPSVFFVFGNRPGAHGTGGGPGGLENSKKSIELQEPEHANGWIHRAPTSWTKAVARGRLVVSYLGVRNPCEETARSCQIRACHVLID